MKSLILIFVFILPNLSQAIEVEGLQGVFEEAQKQGFSGTMIVSQKGKVIFEGTSGFYDKATNTPMRFDDRLYIGSITKHMTVVAFMQLQEQGLVHYNDKLSKYFPDFPKANEITIHHLLTHTSGIYNYTGETPEEALKFPWNKPMTLDEIILSFKDKPFNDFNPGEKHRYSNSGYALISKIIENVSGLALEDYFDKHLFSPLGLRNTAYRKNVVGLKNAEGHKWDRNYNPKNVITTDMSWASGAGAVYSTAEEMLIWSKALRSGKLISIDSYKTMINQCEDSGKGTDTKGYDYCYALAHLNYAGKDVVWHNGGFAGFNAVMMYVPELDVDIILLRNSSMRFAALNYGLFLLKALVSGKAELPDLPKEIKVDTETLRKYVGTYVNESEGGIFMFYEIGLEGGNLYARLMEGDHRQDEYRLIPVKQDQFVYMFPGAVVQFHEDKEAKATGLTLIQGGNIKFEKMDTSSIWY